MNRKDILENAITHTMGQRRDDYGSPYENMTDIGSLWKAYLLSKYPDPHCHFSITAEDVAWMLSLMKMARTCETKKPETYEAAAAYAAIAAECAGGPSDG